MLPAADTVIACDGLPASPAMAAALEKIRADGEASRAARAAIEAKQITVTVLFTPHDGLWAYEALTLEITGIAPFLPARKLGPFTGCEGWTVRGQEPGSSRLRCTDLDGPRWMPPMSQKEAMRLAKSIEQQLTTHINQEAAA